MQPRPITRNSSSQTADNHQRRVSCRQDVAVAPRHQPGKLAHIVSDPIHFDAADRPRRRQRFHWRPQAEDFLERQDERAAQIHTLSGDGKP